jgi:hypothetical protein
MKWCSKDELRKITIYDYTEYYYKDLLTDYLKNKKKVFPLSLIKIRNTQDDNQFSQWLGKSQPQK